MKFIHITTGDFKGIGLEVALKALSQIGPLQHTQFVLWRSALAPHDLFHLVDESFNKVTVKEGGLLSPPPHLKKSKEFSMATLLESQGLNCKMRESQSLSQNKPNTAKPVLWDLAMPEKPTQWVKTAGELCLKNPHTEFLVTGPLSKTQMQKEGFKERGHTELLKNLSQAQHVYMCFMGDHFNVILLTGHVPLKKVQWSEQSLNTCINLCLNHTDFEQGAAFKTFPALQEDVKHASNKTNINQTHFKGSFLKDQKIGVLGFNPHAGEEGLLGTEDQSVKTILKKWEDKVEGPLVPDTAFLKENWPRFFMYICMYHDQGLIPFKMIHGRKSFQINLGLTFKRVSVSHGTAKDIYGQNKADPESMKRALHWTLQSLKDK